MDKLELLHEILQMALGRRQWQLDAQETGLEPAIGDKPTDRAAYLTIIKVGEYCDSAEEGYLKFGWLLRRVNITQAFEVSKTRRLVEEDSNSEFYCAINRGLGAWEHAHNKHVPVLWEDVGDEPFLPPLPTFDDDEED